MKRLWLGGCLMVVLGCGGRTEYFDDVEGAGGQLPGTAGSSASAGSTSIAGALNIAGAPQGAGAPSFGGAPNIAGGPHVAGSPSFGGVPNVAGSPSSGGVSSAGAPHFAGSPSFGGVPNVAGAPSVAGAGGTPGVVQVCQAVASTSCQKCLCSTCSPQIAQCVTNIGCALILACAQQTGCQGLACYAPKTCRPVIDQFGGLGSSSMADALSLLTCSVSSQNSCSCN